MPDRGRRAADAALTGALAALAALGLEQAVMTAAGQRPLELAELGRVAVNQGALGFVAGAGLGVAGLGPVAVLWGLWAFATGALFAGKVGPWALVVTWPACAAVAAALVRLPSPWSERVWTALSAVTVAGFALNLNALGSPTDPAALLTDGLVLLAGGAVFASRVRPSWALGVGLVGVGIATGAVPRPTPEVPPATADRPPVLLVVIDTLRADRLGFMGYPEGTSPSLDALAARGRVYDAAQASAPWTLPSFASMLTGLDPSEHGAGVNLGDGNTRAALSGVPTLAERLRDAGYATAAFTSNPYLRRTYGLDRGFARYDDAVGWGYWPLVAQPLGALGWPGLQGPGYRRAPEMVAAASSFVAGRDDAWFVMLHLMEPHAPYHPDPTHVRGHGLSALYDAEIRTADAALGELFASLPPDTVIIVTSDHGEELGEERAHGPGHPARPHPAPGAAARTADRRGAGHRAVPDRRAGARRRPVLVDPAVGGDRGRAPPEPRRHRLGGPPVRARGEGRAARALEADRRAFGPPVRPRRRSGGARRPRGRSPRQGPGASGVPASCGTSGADARRTRRRGARGARLRPRRAGTALGRGAVERAGPTVRPVVSAGRPGRPRGPRRRAPRRSRAA